MPDLSHLWQRFLLAIALLFGLGLGVAATVFGYSNTAPVNVGWSIFHLEGIPLWTVAVVPLVFVLVAGTIYHWFNSLHHFTEHMRHRRRVHELEAEVRSLRGHLDQLLEMPDHPTVGAEPAAGNGDDTAAANKRTRRKAAAALVAGTKPIAGVVEVEPRPEPDAPTEPQ